MKFIINVSILVQTTWIYIFTITVWGYQKNVKR